MATMAKKASCTEAYLQLIKRFPLRPIRTEAALDTAISVLNSLLDRAKLTSDEKDYRDILGDLIHQFESDHYVMEPVTDAAMLQHLIEAKNATPAIVAKECRIAESTISAILSGQRKPNRQHIAKFAAYFHVASTVFSCDA